MVLISASFLLCAVQRASRPSRDATLVAFRDMLTLYYFWHTL